jgi:peptide/nickel transport system ATP-binding protein
MPADNVLLSIEHLTVQYVTDEAVVHAINDLSISIERGKTLGFVGETGAGKTSTAKAIMRLLPDPPAQIKSGEIRFEGEDLLKKSAKEMRLIRGNKISMIFQDPMSSFDPVIPVINQVEEVFLLHKTRDKAEAHRMALNMLETVGIKTERAEDYPHQFSGGMQQRVVIAIALACAPVLLIADEPTTALDVTIQAQVLELMKQLRDRNKTSMLMITHDLGIVADICDYVAVIYAGNVVEYASLEQIFLNHKHPYTKGLFGCVPDLSKAEKTLVPIAGLIPDPSDLPSGCPFHPRCPEALSCCAEAVPDSIAIAEGHRVRCFLYDEGLKNKCRKN